MASTTEQSKAPAHVREEELRRKARIGLVSGLKTGLLEQSILIKEVATAITADAVVEDAVVSESPESPFNVPADTAVTPKGPNLTPGEPLCFLSAQSPEDSPFQDADESTMPCFTGGEDDSNSPIPTLEPVPIYPDTTVDGPECESPPKVGAARRAWKKISPVEAARQMSSQANRAKDHVSEKVQKSFGYVKHVKEHAGTQVSDKVHKSIGFVKDQTEGARKVPSQVSETAQKGIGYAKDKAGSARDTVTSRVSQTAHKGLEFAKGMMPRAGRRGGA